MWRGSALSSRRVPCPHILGHCILSDHVHCSREGRRFVTHCSLVVPNKGARLFACSTATLGRNGSRPGHHSRSRQQRLQPASEGSPLFNFVFIARPSRRIRRHTRSHSISPKILSVTFMSS